MLQNPSVLESVPSLLDGASGVAEAIPRVEPLAHVHTQSLPIGDVVVACRQFLNPVTFAPDSHELRVFAADAQDSDQLALLDADELLSRSGALAYASLDLSSELDHYPWDLPADKVARLSEFRLAGADATERGRTAASGVADWLLEVIETELVYSTYFALRGDSRSFSPGSRLDASDWDARYRTHDYGAWAAPWLETHGYAVFHDDPGQFFKVFNPPLLELIEAGVIA